MSLYESTLARIVPRNKEIERAIGEQWSTGTPYGSYGKLATMVELYAAATNQVNPTAPKPCMIIACGDHGVAKIGVSAYPQEVTVHMTTNYLIPKGAAANALANYCGAQIEVIDVGVAADMSAVPGLHHHKVMPNGTNNMLEEPAMPMDKAIEAVEVGITFVE